MGTARKYMTVRIVPLQSREAGDARVGGTAEERIAAVTELTEFGWAVAKRPWPVYERATMPVRVTSLRHQDDVG